MPENKPEWFILHDGRTTVSIRPWKPGDGLHCSAANGKTGKVPCGIPVAVLRTVNNDRLRTRGRLDAYAVRNRNACVNHVANAVKGTGYKVPSITTEAEKAAREAVLVAHWDEYKAAFEREVAARQELHLSNLPESLRDALAALESE